jgi:3-oxoacyl-[acyl-carrier-protein] synthase-1
MRDVYVVSDNVLSPLGLTTLDNFQALIRGVTGIRLHHREDISPTLLEPTAFVDPHAGAAGAGAVFSASGVATPRAEPEPLTKFENMLIASIQDALWVSGLEGSDPRTVFILSSTKGNVSLLEKGITEPDRISLSGSAERIAQHFGMVHQPLVVSHACISGLQAQIVALRLIRSGQYDHAIVAGADVITQFILSGFQSFQAVSPEPCKPFDAHRAGVTLGEAAATIILSADPDAVGPTGPTIKLLAGSVSNDANHISGPSRTGQELSIAIQQAMSASGLKPGQVDFISAHGTATLYNDDMEAKAIHLSGLQAVPVNSLKGYFGHTLGAAGLVESILSIQSLRENVLLPTKGYETPGTEMPVNVITQPIEKELNICLKTASGFGGCNAALLFAKHTAH